MAESEGFEPSSPAKGCQFSRLVYSTALPALRGQFYWIMAPEVKLRSKLNRLWNLADTAPPQMRVLGSKCAQLKKGPEDSILKAIRKESVN